MPQDFVPAPGMGEAVFRNKYAWPQTDGSQQSFAERITEVWLANYAIDGTEPDPAVMRLAREGALPTSGRHLQHMKPGHTIRGEKITNCSTSMFSFQKFWLLMQGSGVGRSYANDLCRVNWDYMPQCRFVLSQGHPDYQSWVEPREEAVRLYESESEDTRWFEVGDSAEGWARVVEILETAAFQKIHADKVFVFDFTPVRCNGTPIVGQQGRPASGPLPLIQALQQVQRLRGAGLKPWKQALHIDHYLSQCVQLGGVRRAARIACKPWTDNEQDVLDFINVKRGGFLWSANNSVLCDEEFWRNAAHPGPSKARRIFDAMVSAAYHDQTGEPGFINVDRLTVKDDNLHLITPESLFFGVDVHPRTLDMASKMLEVAKRSRFRYIVNPCGEIILAVWGGYCVIADLCLANLQSPLDAVLAARASAEFLVRANKLEFMYRGEVQRTNRIGVSLTGIFEFAWEQYGLTFFDLLDERKSSAFWNLINEMREAVEAVGRAHGCHTCLTIKPSGTVSKVLGCTEGAHLPAYGYYLRWVVYSPDSPELAVLAARGYPTKFLPTLNQTIVGFPTELAIARMMGTYLVTAGDVSPVQQFQWLRLLEKHWLGVDFGNQVSYTLKYDPLRVSFEEFKSIILRQQPTVRCCSVMPQADLSAYAYQPEQRITQAEYNQLMSKIDQGVETYDDDAMLCAGGACPIELDR